MRREEVIEELEKKLGELGVPAHTRGVRKIPSYVELDILIPPGRQKFEFRSGITRVELNEKLEDLEKEWRLRVGQERQIDLEEAIEQAKRNAAA